MGNGPGLAHPTFHTPPPKKNKTKKTKTKNEILVKKIFWQKFNCLGLGQVGCARPVHLPLLKILSSFTKEGFRLLKKFFLYFYKGDCNNFYAFYKLLRNDLFLFQSNSFPDKSSSLWVSVKR